MSKNGKYKSVTLSKETHENLVRVAGNLQSERGIYISMDEAIKFLLECLEKREREKKQKGQQSKLVD